MPSLARANLLEEHRGACVSIKDDLEHAQSEADALVTVEEAVDELARVARITSAQAAHWLVLKGVHQQVPAYHLYPLGYAKEKLPLTHDRKGYQAVYDALFGVVNPSILSLAPILMGVLSEKRPDPEVTWVRSEIQAFIVQNGGAYAEAEMDGGEVSARGVAGTSNGDSGIKQVRKDKLLAGLRATYDDIMNIPVGGKATTKSTLCDSDPQTFTDSTFDAAWKELSVSGVIAIVGKEAYAKGSSSSTS